MTTVFSPSTARAVLPWYRHRWPWLIMAGPAAVVVASSVSAWLAFSREDQMVVNDYYEQGLVINQDLQRDARASALGLGFAGQYDAASEHLSGTLTGQGKPIGAAIRIQLRHATQPRRDRTLAVVVGQGGTFTMPLPLLDASRWTVTVEDQQRSWRLTGLWQWPQQRQVVLHADAAAANKR